MRRSEDSRNPEALDAEATTFPADFMNPALAAQRLGEEEAFTMMPADGNHLGESMATLGRRAVREREKKLGRKLLPW